MIAGLPLALFAASPAFAAATRLSTEYVGVGHNIPANIDGHVRITNLTETEAGAIAGQITWYAGLAGAGPFTGTVEGATVRFSSTIPNRAETANHCGGASYAGTIGLGGKVSGTYVIECSIGGPENGTFEVMPAVPPEVFGPSGVVQAPSPKRCLSGRAFTIHIRHYPGITYRKVGVSLNGRPVHVANGRTAIVNLRGLTKGRYTVFIKATTTTGAKISGTRTYHTCAKRPIHPKRHARL